MGRSSSPILNDSHVHPTIVYDRHCAEAERAPTTDHRQQPLPFLHLQPFRPFPSYVIRLRDSDGRGPTLLLPILPVTRHGSHLANNWILVNLSETFACNEFIAVTSNTFRRLVCKIRSLSSPAL